MTGPSIEETACPFCGKEDVEALTYEVETRMVRTSGLIFPRGEGPVRTGTTLTVKHRSGRECVGAPPLEVPVIGPLTDAQIAELRQAATDERQDSFAGWPLAKRVVRLLDEVERARRESRSAVDHMRDILDKAGADLTFTPEGPVLVVRQLERARALLRRIEWNAGGREGPACPCCFGGDPTKMYNDRRGHDPDCELAAVIRSP